MALGALFRSCTITAVTLKTKPLQNLKGGGPVSKQRKTRENLFYHENTHNCGVFPQWEARRRTRVPTANLQLGEGSGLPCHSADSSPREDGIQSNTRQELTQNFTCYHHPQHISTHGNALQPKKPPTKQQGSPSLQVLLLLSLHQMPRQGKSR